MAIGDALAVALLDARGFKEDDFARSHPGGALGRRLLTLVSDVMRPMDQVPRVHEDTEFTALMKEMSDKGLGACAMVSSDLMMQGVFTDGDLRRLVEKGHDLRGLKAIDVMNKIPKVILQSSMAVEAAQMMENYKITSIFVVNDKNQICGALNSNDLMQAKVI